VLKPILGPIRAIGPAPSQSIVQTPAEQSRPEVVPTVLSVVNK
jgi:hypothetical protein